MDEQESVMKFSSVARIWVAGCALSAAVSVYAEGAPEHSMTGCLREGAAPGTYMLTDLGLDKGPQTVEIAGSSVDLSGHVGHKVEITGTSVAAKDPAGHAMQITAMKHLAATCP
jgi:hypothetical protein